ncbi:MAG: 4-hydroxy-3-methylbut-2-enyl diphosphate reductase, partial [Firmicutes bacterium]|nr:4-hydroxy-3-methylbut-2-enyl diphosphate reductase [Candidatus Caballimonas caccae]
LIHNDIVNENLKKRGIKTIDIIDDIHLKKDDNVLIRTHGETKANIERLNEIGCNVIDCTCPFVEDIHKKVSKYYSLGYKIIIVGNSMHPEVIGINGWCENKALITENYEDVNKLTDEKICIVVQTTYSTEKFEDFIKKIVFNGSKTVEIFKTICYTTNMRRIEAEMLSKTCDSIIVLGGVKSNNTQKLFDLCRENNENVFRIFNPSSFEYEKLKKFKRVGIVFGASTPFEQFQEVIQNMENVVTEEIVVKESNEVSTSQNVKSEMEVAFDSIKPSKDFRIGQIVTAKISSANENGLTVSLKNAKKDFEIDKDELLNEYSEENYVVGNDIKVMVVAKNPIRFSEKAMQKVLAEESEVAEIKNGKIFEAVIEGTNKGGLIAKHGSYSVFIPSSQIKLGFVKDLDKYVGKTLRLKAEKVESKGSRRQIVASQRVILLAEKEERDAIRAQQEADFFSSIQEGDVVLGTPVRFAPFGAFVDVNGFDCLVHISDLSWTGCKDCAEVLELNKQYEFKILKIDVETKRVSIGYKQLQPKPWDTILERYNVGDTIKGKVVRIVPFGAFVEVEKGIDGLVHVSQISNKYIENPVTALQVGQEVDAKIIDINIEKEKMNLSIKALLPDAEPTVKDEGEEKVKGKKGKKVDEEPEVEELHEWKEEENTGVSIADLLNK